MDDELYNEYLYYNPVAIFSFKEIAKYSSEDFMFEYGPDPKAIMELNEIIQEMPEDQRIEYVENSFKKALAIIVKGSEDLSYGSLLLNMDIARQFNIDSYLFTNMGPSIYYIDNPIISYREELIADIEKMSQSLNGQSYDNINTNFKTRDEFLDSIKEILESNKDVDKLYLFINTHGSPDSLWFGPGNEVEDPDYHFLIFPEDLVNLLKGRTMDSTIILESCSSNKFSRKLKGYSNIKVVSYAEEIGYGGDDMPNSLLIASYKNDRQITVEELFEISDHLSPDYVDMSGYHYIVNNHDITIYDDTVSECHTKKYNLDIQVINNNNDSSIIYYHLSPLDEYNTLKNKSDLISLVGENKFKNRFKDFMPIPDLGDYLDETYSFSLRGELEGDYLDYYEWYSSNIKGPITIPNTYDVYNVNTEDISSDLLISTIIDGRILEYYFFPNRFNINVLLNREDILGFDFHNFTEEILSSIQIHTGMTLQCANAGYSATVPGEIDIISEKFRGFLNKQYIDYDYRIIEEDNYVDIQYNYRDINVAISLYSAGSDEYKAYTEIVISFNECNLD